MKDIDFYFSIGSTYTYLSVTRILDVEKKNQVKFNWKPFSVRMIMKEMNNIPFPKDKINKVNYMWRDIYVLNAHRQHKLIFEIFYLC